MKQHAHSTDLPNKLNPTFISNIKDIYGDAGIAWIKNLPDQIKTLSDLWHFDLIRPMENLSYNFVGLVKLNATNNTAIVKIAFENARLLTEVEWLKSMSHCVPTVYNFDTQLNAFLMEHLIPGESLKALLITIKDDAATKIICQVIIDLQSGQKTEPSLRTEFKHLSEFVKSLNILEGIYNKKLLDHAKSLFHDLTIDRKYDVILHGDLHHDNIISSGSEWKAIDPHGYIGDPAAEVGAMIRNPWDCFPKEHALSKTIERRLAIMKENLPFDSQKIKAWAFCMTVLSAAWTVENHPHATASDLDMDVTEAILKTKI
ncbi:MAG TPA: aminoglycoside phosphotransferase family protein [Gammaproteobacteria bacterium]|nr:aminoglycoside phosphotransferase family protein [Gammaproteobacteria bacterium]